MAKISDELRGGIPADSDEINNAATSDLMAEAADLLDECERMLAWYEEHARLARLVHSEGDKGRNAIAADGGAQARSTLAKLRGETLDNS